MYKARCRGQGSKRGGGGGGKSCSHKQMLLWQEEEAEASLARGPKRSGVDFHKSCFVYQHMT